jgi:hypothetical protein
MPDDGKPGKGDAKKALCFVIGVIGKDGTAERKHSDLLLNLVIKHVLKQDEFGYIVKRADEDTDPGMIGDRVVSDIIHADLVVADLTDLNPNAFYELGIRHSTEKPTIHIARAGTILPFDTVAHRTIFVDLADFESIEQGRERLANSARAIKAPDYKVSNPITQANASFKMRQSEDPRDRVLAQMQERLAVLEKNATNVIQRVGVGDLKFTRLANAIAESLKRKQYAAAAEQYRGATKATDEQAMAFINAVMSDDYPQVLDLLRSTANMDLNEATQFMHRLKSFE